MQRAKEAVASPLVGREGDASLGGSTMLHYTAFVRVELRLDHFRPAMSHGTLYQRDTKVQEYDIPHEIIRPGGKPFLE